MASISPETLVARSHRQAHCILDDRAVLMDVETGEYFELNQAASRLWLAIEPPTSVVKLVDTLLGEYEVERTACEEAVLEWLVEMARLGFIELRKLEPT